MLAAGAFEPPWPLFRWRGQDRRQDLFDRVLFRL
jgi:hypothetical protein